MLYNIPSYKKQTPFFIFFISVPPIIRQIRPLFKFGDEEKIKDGLINFVTSAGVVSALLIGISSNQAFGVTPYDFMSSICVFAWYLSTWMSMWCVVLSTGLGVLLSITPQQNLREVGQKLLYLWVLPAWLMIFSCIWMFVAIWAQAEMGYRIVLALNQTSQPHLATQQAIIVWVSRLSFGFTCVFGIFAFFMTMFCAHKCRRYTGIETIDVAPTDSKKGKELLKLHLKEAKDDESKDDESKSSTQEKKKRSKSRAGTEGLVSVGSLNVSVNVQNPVHA